MRFLLALLLVGCSSSPIDKIRMERMKKKQAEKIIEIRKIREHHSRWVIHQIKIRLLNERLDVEYGK